MEEHTRIPPKNLGFGLVLLGARWVTCVPRVVATCPGQVPGEGEVQVENPPGQDNDVIEV